VPAVNLNHVSVSALDLETSLRFYEDLFGVERIPTPNFGFPVQWTRVGPLQLHLFERPGAAPHSHHFALTVDDIDDVFARATALDAFDRTTFGHHVYELPGGEVQLYLRDPGGNLVEVDWPSVATAGAAVRAQIRPLSEGRPQTAENMQARLFLDPHPGRVRGDPHGA